MKIMMPSANVKQVGLGKILSKSQINKVFEQIKTVEVVRENRWEKRYRMHTWNKLKVVNLQTYAQFLNSCRMPKVNLN